MGRNNIDLLIGKKINRLTLLSESDVRLKQKNKRYGVFICDCGQQTIQTIFDWTNGGSKSCGCLKKENGTKTHGLSATSDYKSYQGIKGRCLNKNHGDYKNYGAKGVSICDEWLTFEGFLRDMGFRKDTGLNDPTIERIDVEGNYCKENCKWIERELQAKNKRCRIALTY